jgi:DAK2 domain fusion protein YloV
MGTSNEMLSAVDFRRMIAGAYGTFTQERDYIDGLNVFPVPDGDTGTNMLLTLAAVEQTIAGANTQAIGQISRLAADSAIMGARGNSGVILAQLFRGIARGLAGKETASSSELGKAFQYGILYAYRAVSRPVEGTILTVAKGIAKGTRRAVRDGLGFADILAEAIAAGETELARTPELLPVLKTAGVVDAGGRGLVTLLRGCLEGLQGYYSSPEADFGKTLKVIEAPEVIGLTHPYCTEFVVKAQAVSEAEARHQLEPLGESLILAEATGALKVHIHTAHPGTVIETALSWGTLHNLKIDNMADQHRNIETAAKKSSGLGIIAVSPGDGISEILKSMGVNTIINGGQTMNPPVEVFVNAVHQGNFERYIILPNNRNIILAATQAKKLLGDRVEVVESRSVPQGLAALTAYSETAGVAENLAAMRQRMASVKAAGVATAIRDSMLGDKRVATGSFIGVVDNKVIVAGTSLAEVLPATVEKLVTPECAVISLYYGDEVNEREAGRLAADLEIRFPQLEIELYNGGQQHYQFFIGIE